MPSRPRLADPGALIRDGKPRTDTFQVCLEPDLITEHEQLVEERAAAKEAAQDSLAGGNVVELDERIADVLERMRAATVTLVLRALPRAEFRRLCDKHPPRKDADGNLTHPTSDFIGVDADGFFDELLPIAIVEPDLDEETLRLLLEERLTDRQYVDLTDVAWNLNRSKVSVPFSPAVSPKPRSSSPR